VETTERAEGATIGQTRPVYTRVHVFGLVLAAVTLLVAGTAAIINYPPSFAETAGFLAPFVIGLSLAAWLAWRFGTWAKIVGVLVALAAAAFLFWVVFGLFEIDSVIDFAIGFGVSVGLLLAIGGGIAAIMSGRRGRTASAPTRGERTLVRTVLSIFAVGLVVSLVLTLTSHTTIDPQLASGAAMVEINDFVFEPSPVEVSSADGRLVVANNDVFVHDFTVPALDVEVRLTPRSNAMVDLAGAPSGTYTAYCTLHSNTNEPDPEAAGMAVALVIR
jgi:plastocyanin